MPPDHKLVLSGDLERGFFRSSAACRRDSPPLRPSTDWAEVPVPKKKARCLKIRDQMIEALGRKTDAILWLMDRYEWQFFLAGFYEAHRAGHNLWPIVGAFASETRFKVFARSLQGVGSPVSADRRIRRGCAHDFDSVCSTRNGSERGAGPLPAKNHVQAQRALPRRHGLWRSSCERGKPHVSAAENRTLWLANYSCQSCRRTRSGLGRQSGAVRWPRLVAHLACAKFRPVEKAICDSTLRGAKPGASSSRIAQNCSSTSTGSRTRFCKSELPIRANH